ncbi:MAG TPA: dockerin type I repeat-containing protein, partial [Armatimonadota bacterium]|nr:dockerin type I repeat-containing protein [Armatimonadota bacterium]
KGDINGDGLVTPLDAIHALRIAGGLEGIITRKAQGDVNVDGKVDITDATMILRKTDGLAGF